MEVCAEGGVLVQRLAGRVEEHRGAALIADYGHDGTKTDTFRVRRLSRTLLLVENLGRINGLNRTEVRKLINTRAPSPCRVLKATGCTTSWTLLEQLTSPPTWTSATCAAWLEEAWPVWGHSPRGRS